MLSYTAFFLQEDLVEQMEVSIWLSEKVHVYRFLLAASDRKPSHIGLRRGVYELI